MSKATPGMEHLPWGHLLLGACTAKPWTLSRNTFDFQLSVSQLPASKAGGEAPQCLALCPASDPSPTVRPTGSALTHIWAIGLEKESRRWTLQNRIRQRGLTSPRKDQELLHAMDAGGPPRGMSLTIRCPDARGWSNHTKDWACPREVCTTGMFAATPFHLVMTR